MLSLLGYMIDLMDNTVKIYWRKGDTIQHWNEQMAWVTEEFGLPGDRWHADVTTNHMTIFFKHDCDCVFARLKLG